MVNNFKRGGASAVMYIHTRDASRMPLLKHHIDVLFVYSTGGREFIAVRINNGSRVDNL